MDDGPTFLFADDDAAGGGGGAGGQGSAGTAPNHQPGAAAHQGQTPGGYGGPPAGAHMMALPKGPRAAPVIQGGPSVKLFFGQVPRTWTDLQVRELFDKYGSLSDFVVLRYKDTGASKGENGPGDRGGRPRPDGFPAARWALLLSGSRPASPAQAAGS